MDDDPGPEPREADAQSKSNRSPWRSRTPCSTTCERASAATRWPDPAPGEPWSQGTDLDYLRDLLAYWADGFDWRARERQLNRYDHRIADVDGVRLHFVHHRRGTATGCRWSSPTAGRARSWSCCRWSTGSATGSTSSSPRCPATRSRPARRAPVSTGRSSPACGTAHAGAGLRALRRVRRRLRRRRRHAHGAVGPRPGRRASTSARPRCRRTPGRARRRCRRRNRRTSSTSRAGTRRERGYSAVQSTRPQTLGYGLNDSPAGLAAWVLDKWRSWSDSDGDLDARFGRDALLTMLTIWWATGSITSSMRDYYDNRWHGTALGPDDRVRVPTAMAVFAERVRAGGRAAPVVVRAALRRSERWTVFPARRALRRGRGARPAGRRHRGVLRGPFAGLR